MSQRAVQALQRRDGDDGPGDACAMFEAAQTNIVAW
jgi:hypothetical protein